MSRARHVGLGGDSPSPVGLLAPDHEWTIGEDDLIAASLGHFDQAEYKRRLEQGAGG